MVSVLIKFEIDLCAEETSSFEEAENNIKDKFEVLYDNSIFSENISDKSDAEFVKTSRQVKQNNATLCKLIQDGNEFAKQELCIKNKGLVNKIANKCYRLYGNDLEFDDLVQLGMEGLLKAAERFDLDKENAFSTYAVWWIFQSISRGLLMEGFRIRVPVHMMELIAKVEKKEKQLILEGYDPTEIVAEIQKRLDISREKVMECLKIRRYYLSCESLNFQVGEDEDTEIQDLVVNNDEKSVEDIIIEKDINRMINNSMLTLTDKEQEIIKLRFGLEDDKERTLEEIGHKFDLTRERIRQIEANAFRKLRHPSRSKRYNNFF